MRDEKIQDLLDSIRDAFDFAQEAAPLKNVTTVQTGKYSYAHVAARLLLQWLYPVIRKGHPIPYVAFCFCVLLAIINILFEGKRLLKNVKKIGEVDKQITALCNTLVELQKAFLDLVTITTEVTVVQILDDVGTLSANINLISDHLDAVTTQLSDLGM